MPSFAARLMKVARRPGLILDRARSVLASRRKGTLDPEVELQRLGDFLSLHFGADLGHYLHEYESSDFSAWYSDRKQALLHDGKAQHGISSDFDCRALYLLVRVAKPTTVVETGVLYGASSSHILEAQQKNGLGRLYSIDLPAESTWPPKDFFVRDNTWNRTRWEMILGDSRRELGALLTKLGSIDLFFHDSLHTFEHMSWEFGTAWPFLGEHGIIASHDALVVPPFRNAFVEFCQSHDMAYGVFRNIGMSVRTNEC